MDYPTCRIHKLSFSPLYSIFFVVSQNLKICLDYLATTRARSTIIKLYLKGQRLKLDLSRYQITNIIFDFRREQKKGGERGT